MHDRHAQGVIVPFVPAVFAFAENRHTERAAFICQIDPFLGRHFKQRAVHVAAADVTQAKVKRRLRVFGCKRELVFDTSVAVLPLYFRINLHNVRAVGQRNIVCKRALVVLARHLERHTHRAALLYADGNTGRHKIRLLIQILIIQLPCRPVLAALILKHTVDDRRFQNFTVVQRLVHNRGNIAVFIETHNIFLVFQHAFFRNGNGAGKRARHIAHAHIISAAAHGRHIGHEKQRHAAVGKIGHLRFDLAPLVVKYARKVLCRIFDFQRHRRTAAKFEHIADNDRHAACKIRFHPVSHSGGRAGKLAGKTIHGNGIIVPRTPVSTLYRSTGQVVMELVGNKALPMTLHSGVRICFCTDVLRDQVHAFRHVSQLLAAPVPALADGTRGVAAGTVVAHDQLCVPNRKLFFLLRRQVLVQVMKDLICRHRKHFQVRLRIFPDLLLHKRHRFFRRRAAAVANAVKYSGQRQVVLFIFFQLFLHKIPVAQFGKRKVVVVRVDVGINVIAVGPVPFADVKRHAVSRAPGKLLGRKAF